jgi:hypothetical protein
MLFEFRNCRIHSDIVLEGLFPNVWVSTTKGPFETNLSEHMTGPFDLELSGKFRHWTVSDFIECLTIRSTYDRKGLNRNLSRYYFFLSEELYWF